ncbi:MAG: PilZ domain-containing protein [Myxococcales bacterium]|nr:PilZ domain-containing protein [Myxococcales bacterium]
MRRIRCHYASGEAFVDALQSPGEDNAIQVFTTERFEPGEEVLAEVFFSGLPGKMIVRAIGKKWQNARPRLRVRAGGVLRCIGSEWRKLLFLRDVALGCTEMMPRRRHVRQPVLVEIRWRRAGDPELAPATISEISEAGALLLTRDPLALGDEIIIEITPPGSARPLELQAVIRNHDNPEGCGVEFVARDMGGVHRIREVIRRIVDE